MIAGWPRLLALRCVAALMAVAALTCASKAAAAPSRVVLLRPPRSNASAVEAVNRAQAELRAEGFEVVVRDAPSEATPRSSLEAAAQREGAIAAIAVHGSQMGAVADLWVIDRITEKTVVRRVDVSDVPPDKRPVTLAIRAVELLRASLVEAVSPMPSTPKREVPPEVSEFVAPSGSPLEGFAVQLGAAMVASTGGIGIAGAPLVRLSLGSDLGIAGRLSWVGPAFGARAEGALGSATIRQERLTLDLAYAPAVSWYGLSPLAWLGVGFHHMEASGELVAPLVGTRDDVWAFAAVAGAGMGYRFTKEVMLVADFELLLAAPRPVVTMRGQPIGHTGRPAMTASLGVAARF